MLDQSKEKKGAWRVMAVGSKSVYAVFFVIVMNLLNTTPISNINSFDKLNFFKLFDVVKTKKVIY